jgi:hypothetical protein
MINMPSLVHLSWPRTFQLWSYTVNHGQPLLRSTKGGAHSSRIDVLFKDVAAVCLPTIFPDLTIEELGPQQAPPVGLGPRLLKDRTFFKVSCIGFSGYMIAGCLTLHEDEGEYHEPGALLPRVVRPLTGL